MTCRCASRVGSSIPAPTSSTGTGRHLRQPRGHAGEGLPDGSDLARCRADVEGVGVVPATALTARPPRAALEVQPDLEPVPVPSIVDNLGEIGSTPWLLAGLRPDLRGGLAYALMVGVQRHRHDVAVVRALGMRPTQGVRWCGGRRRSWPRSAPGSTRRRPAGRSPVWQRAVHGVGRAGVGPGARRRAAARPLVAIGLGLLLVVSQDAEWSLSPATVLKAE